MSLATLIYILTNTLSHSVYVFRFTSCGVSFKEIKRQKQRMNRGGEREIQKRAIDKREFDKGRRRENIELIEPLE